MTVMPEPLHCPAKPCTSCPYRRDVPSGVWAADEYAKLPEFDENPGPLSVFHCHQENATGRPTVCLGWLAVHGLDSIGVRLAITMGQFTSADVDAAEGCGTPLWPSGAAAAAHGLARIDDPDDQAHTVMARLIRRNAGRL